MNRFRLLILAAAFTTTAVLAVNEPSITVTEQRYGIDARIQAEVMNVLAHNSELSGKIGVETKDQVVNLSGYLATPGQVWRAGRDASQVAGVKYVVNEIRPLMGKVGN
jgi:osmotically-inducible protein OsmY